MYLRKNGQSSVAPVAFLHTQYSQCAQIHEFRLFSMSKDLMKEAMPHARVAVAYACDVCNEDNANTELYSEKEGDNPQTMT